MPAELDYYRYGHPLCRLRSYFALKTRSRIYGWFVQSMQPTPTTRVLDLGVSPDDLLPESNFFLKTYPHTDKVVAASIEDAAHLEGKHPGLKFIKLAPGRLPFADNEFDILHCSAVIEHVGSRDAQLRFVMEAVRVSRRCFFTTPHRMFPIEFHTFLPMVHWLPQPTHQRILRALGLRFWAETDNLNLLTPRTLRALFPRDLRITLRTYCLFGMPSNIVACGVK